MEILGRTVEAVRYEGAPLVNAYVNQKPGDCIKQSEPAYQCMGNCEGKIIIARFQDKQPLSIKALVPTELSVHPQMPALRDIKDLPDLEAVANQPGYELKAVNKGKALYYNSQQVAVYNPCGFTTDSSLFSGDVRATVVELVNRVDELYEIAKTVPLGEVLNDVALKHHLNDPRMLQMALALGGPDAAKLVEQLRKMQKEN